MQFKFWLSDTDFLTFACKFSNAGPYGAENPPELIAASITESKLSIDKALAMDVLGQVVDYFSAPPDAAVSTALDWRDDFRRGKI